MRSSRRYSLRLRESAPKSRAGSHVIELRDLPRRAAWRKCAPAPAESLPHERQPGGGDAPKSNARTRQTPDSMEPDSMEPDSMEPDSMEPQNSTVTRRSSVPVLCDARACGRAEVANLLRRS